jgi:hypothetical protein
MAPVAFQSEMKCRKKVQDMRFEARTLSGVAARREWFIKAVIP